MRNLPQALLIITGAVLTVSAFNPPISPAWLQQAGIGLVVGAFGVLTWTRYTFRPYTSLEARANVARVELKEAKVDLLRAKVLLIHAEAEAVRARAKAMEAGVTKLPE